jgi:LysR family transcriptional activator of mexEF-oprN operon
VTDLRLFDLNLLVAFDALLAERSVTHAARRVGIGQPAMSHALSRLRELFGDPLFVRTTGKMRPTTLALELAAPIARVLADIRESVLADRAFAPDRGEMTFRVGASDQNEPTVLAALRSSAPKVRIAVSTVDRHRLDTMLENGAVDLAIGYFPDPPNARTSKVLFREEFVCLFDAKACGASSPLKLRTYLELPHIIMSLRGQLSGDADTIIGRGGGKCFVFMATPHFLAIPFLLHGFRAVAAVPRRLAENCAEVAGLDISPLPIAMDGYDVSMQWHSRTEMDPAQRWFRELVRVSGRAKVPASRSTKRQ